MQYVVDNLLHNTPMQARRAGSQHTVRENRPGQEFYIIGNDIGTPVNGGVSLGRAIKGQRAARTHTQLNPVVPACGAHQINDICLDAGINMHPANYPLQVCELLRGKYRLHLLQRPIFAETLQNQPLLRLAGIAQAQAHQKAIKLRLRQWKRAFQFHRVLGRNDYERARQWHRLALHADLSLLHSLQQRGLCARCGAVDLVRQHNLREQRTGSKFKLSELLIVKSNTDNIRRKQIRGKLNALERAAKRTGQRFSHGGFANARHILEEHMSLAEQRNQQQIDHFLFSHDHVAHTLEHRARHILYLANLICLHHIYLNPSKEHKEAKGLASKGSKHLVNYTLWSAKRSPPL